MNYFSRIKTYIQDRLEWARWYETYQNLFKMDRNLRIIILMHVETDEMEEAMRWNLLLQISDLIEEENENEKE